MVVEGLLYTKEHEWAKIEGNSATIGITDYAQQQLGEITFVELPEAGSQLQQSEEFAVIESSKAASDVYAPLSGKVTEINSLLETEPELINNDCYNSGWVCKIEITDKKGVENLMNAKQYEQFLKEQ